MVSNLTKAPEGVFSASHRGLFTPDSLRVCTRTVMDNSDPNITFDADGVSNWYHDFQREKARNPCQCR